MIKKRLKNYRNIIWDWNGTLLNDVQLCANIMNGLLVSRSLPAISIERYREIFTFPVRDYYLKAGHNFNNVSFEKIGVDFIVEYEKKKNNCALYPFAKEVLARFQSLNIKQFLLSAYKQDNLENIVNYYGILEYFSLIRGLDNIYADGKLELAKNLMKDIPSNGSNNSTLLIGDTIHDYEVADEIGVDCLLVSNGHQNEKRLMELDTHVINNLEKLISLLN